uniref:Ubiquitin carboxyl-terminal hydrolase n=1 Tax=Caenorhabditis tropicalis TaxID=1561998 RepID=A0A1I7UNN8_9PELO
MPTPEDVPMEENDVQCGESQQQSVTPSREELKSILNEIDLAEMHEDEWWYLIGQRWWTSLVKAIRDGFVDDVGPIDNSQISESRQGVFYLKPRLAEQVDYTAVPEKLFKRLEAIYQVDDDRRDYIRRQVVKKNGQLNIEVYPRIVHISLARNRDVKTDLVLRPDDTMVSLRERVVAELGLDDNKNIRFYVMNDDNPELIDTSQSIDSYFDTVQKVVVDVEENGEFLYKHKNPVQPQSKSLFGNRSPSSSSLGGNGAANSYNLPSPSTGVVTRSIPGACGLSNLGNTCFMASAFQCLSNMPPLRDYFLSDEYLKDINEANPLGTHGNLARAVGDLMRGMWSGEYASINPRKFKGIIGQFAPRFNGYSQQDAHELMAYVLDGLHEDLNRIKKKPYIEDNDEDAKLPESEYAAKSWDIYKMRNDSIIVDTLHGQLKSTLICPVCKKISIKFDPFGYLSLPLPPKEQIVKQTVIVMFLNRKWAKFSLGITDTTTVEEAEKLMLDKLQPEERHHFVFFHVPSQYHDDISILQPGDKVRMQGREVYVAEVEHDLEVKGTRIFVAYNRVKLVRSASLPMVYSLAPGFPLTRGFLNDHVFSTTKKFFINQKVVAELNGNSNDDDSMSGSNSADEREPYKLFVGTPGSQTPLPIPPTNDPISFPDEMSNDVYRNYLQIVFQWKDLKFFNQYKGNDLIEREMTVSTRRKVLLEETLDWFTKKEQLGEQDSWYCPECKKHERATKQLDLWKLPEVLILHLKRFQYTKWSREKLTWDVVIPVRGLDLTDKVANPNHEKAIYDLIAVSRHYGSLSGGHYTAIGFNDRINKWIDFNDSSANVTIPPSEPYESSDPYILVYRRRPLDANGEPIQPAALSEQHIGRSKRGAASTISSSRHQVDENMEMEED